MRLRTLVDVDVKTKTSLLMVWGFTDWACGLFRSVTLLDVSGKKSSSGHAFIQTGVFALEGVIYSPKDLCLTD